MAKNNLVLFEVLIICSSFLLIILPQNSCGAHNVPKLKHCGLDAIYTFGASMSDTGNSIVLAPFAWHSKLPYGKTINKATGRASDGLLIIDYIAKSAGLPLVDPYKNLSAKHLSTRHGVNFAVGGATTLAKEVLEGKNITMKWVNNSLNVQFEWFGDYLKGYCHDVKVCRKILKSSLFVLNFGNNDYYNAFTQNYTIEDVKKNGLVIDVVEAMKHAVTKLVHRGARKILVFGLSQNGCAPNYLTKQSLNKSATYDEFQCAKDYNDFFMYHNEYLQKGLKKLRKKHPHANIVYGDLYNAMQSILDNSKSLGFKSRTKACCGSKSKYNFIDQIDKLCGAPSTFACSNPEKYIYWDGGHYTQQTNKHMTNWLIENIFPKFKCTA